MMQVCHLVMNESFHEDMLVLSVSDAVQICNMSNIPLTVAAVIGHPEDVQVISPLLYMVRPSLSLQI